MAGPGKNPELEMFIDVKAKTGQVDMGEFFRVLVNGLEHASVPAVSIAPNVVLDKSLTAAKIKKILKGAAEQAKGLSDAYKADSSLGKADPRLVSAYANASSTFNEALTLLSQKQLKEHFAGVNKKLLSEAKSNITAGKALTPQQDAVFKQYGEGVALLEKQMSQLAARLTKLSSGAASFPVDLSHAKLFTEYKSLVATQKQFATQRAEDDKKHERALVDDIRHEKEKLRVQAAQLDAAQRLARYQQILTKGGSAGFANLTRTEKEEASILRQMIAAGQRRAGDIKGAAVTNAQYAAAAGDTREYEISQRLIAGRQNLRQLRQTAGAVTIGKLTDEDRAYLMRGLAQMATDYRALGRDRPGAKIEGEIARLRRENSKREEDERRIRTEAKKNADRLARDQQRAAEAGARAQSAYGRMDPLLRQASTGGLGSLSPQQRHILQSSLKEFTGRLGASGQQSAIEYAAKLTAVYNALAKAERDVEAANRSRTRQMAQAATAEQASIGRLARIAQLEQQIAGAAGSANALDVSMLAKQYERQIQHYDRTGKDQEAAELRAKLNAMRNPAAAAEEAARALEISRGNQVLSNVGGLSGVGNVNPVHARFVQAALEDRRHNIGAQLSTTAPGAAYNDLVRQLNDVDDAMRRLHTNTRRTNGVVAQFFRYALGYGALWQMLGALKGVVTGVTDLERALTAIKAVSGATDVEMQSVSTAIFSVGKNSRYTMAEVTDAAKILAQAGVSADKMGSALKNVTNLASAIEAPIAVVADLMTSMKEIFSAESDTSLANQLASAVNISKLTAEGLQTIIGLSGNVSESMNLTSQQYLAAVATLKNAGLKDSTVATGMRQLLLELQAPDDKLVKAFQERYAAIGEKMTASAVKDKLFDMFQGPGGLNKALVELERLGYNNAGRQTFSRAFDIRSQNALEALIRERQSLLGNEAKIGFSQASVIGSQQQMETLQARITELKNSFILFGDSVGKDALPPLMAFIETVSKAVQGLTELNEQMRSESGVGMGGIFGGTVMGAATGFALTGGTIAQRGIGAAKGAAYGTGYGYLGMQADAADTGFGENLANGAAYGLMAYQAYDLLKGARGRSASNQMNGPGTAPAQNVSDLQVIVAFISAFANSMAPGIMTMLRGAIAFMSGPFGLAIAAIAGVVGLVVMNGKTAAEKAEQMKRQLESTNRLALEKSDAYRTQKDSVAELNVNNASTATGMGAKVIDVEDAYARVNEVVSGYVGAAADNVIERLAFIGAHGGTSALSNRGAIAELKKFEGLANMTDAKLSELVGMASEVVAGPAALAESLTKTYAQLKGMDYEKLNDGQQALVYAFEMTGRAREGFAKTATKQMTQIRDLFRLAEQKSKELKGTSDAAAEANKALNNSRDEMRETFKRGNFMSMKTAVMEWAVSLDSMGKSAVAYLGQEAKLVFEQEAVLRKKAADLRAKKTGRKYAEGTDASLEAQARAAEDQANSLRDAGLAITGERAERRYDASTANTTLRKEVTDLRLSIGEAQQFFGGDLKKFSASPGYAEAMALLKGGSAEQYSTMQSTDMNKLLKESGALPSLSVDGDGQTNPGSGMDRLGQFRTIVTTEQARLEEERKKRGETETELSRFRADRLRDNAIKDIDRKVSSAGQLGELEQLFKPIDGGGSIFDKQRELVKADFATELGNAKLAADAFSTDPRTKRVEVKYEKFNEKQTEIAEKHRDKLNEITNDETNKQRDRDVKRAEAEKKTAEGVLKVEQERLDTIVSIGGAAADVVPAIDAQQKAHEAVAAAISKTVYEQQKKEDGDEAALAAGKEAAALYLEQNVSLAKQVEYLAKAADSAAKITEAEIARKKISILGMTPREYAYRKGTGHAESMHEIRAQDEMELFKERELYDIQRNDLAAAEAKIRAAEKAGNVEAIAAAQSQIKGINRSLDDTDARIGAVQAKLERSSFGGGLRHGLGIGPEGDRRRGLRDLANAHTAHSWEEMGVEMLGGIDSSINAIGDSLARAIVNGEKFKDVFKGMIHSIALDLASFFAKKAVWWFLKSFLGENVPFTGDGTSGGLNAVTGATGGTLRFSGGGVISGPGTGTSDSIPGMLVDGNRRQPLLLSNGESVLTARATNMLGADFITAANRGNVRRQVAVGAAISRGGAVTNIASGNQTTNNLEVNVPVSMSTSAQGTDMDATVAQKLAAKVKSTVRETMLEEARPGGLLYRR